MKRRDGSAGAVDLAETAENREMRDILRARACLLTGADRTLVELCLEQGGNYHQIASVAGLSSTTVARRMQRVIRRLTDETCPACLNQHGRFSEEELAVIRDYFVRGVPMSRISRRRRATYYRVRAIVQDARRFAASVQTASV